ncbi:MAG: trypsin-like peptidase domain-containing protein [Ferruginibacter sp.]
MSTNVERYVIRHTAGSKNNQVEEFDFNKSSLSIGRAAGSDIQYDPEQDSIVSREHGKIEKISSDPPKFTITDNNSRNGIFVNKNRVKGTVSLELGDQVQLGMNGPVFTFDIHPRPQDMMAATRVVEIPTSIKATTISETGTAASLVAEPAKTGLGKQTVERMLVNERKKSNSRMGLILGGLVVVLGILGYAFKDKLFKKGDTIINPVVKDSATMNKKTPEAIAKENMDKVVQIEFGWQLFDANTSDELWHKYLATKGTDGLIHYTAMYIQNSRGEIEPYLDVKKNVPIGTPVGFAGASGSGFVVSEDGFILTNRHVATNWNTRYSFPDYAFPGVLVQYAGGRETIAPGVSVMPEDVFGFVPSEASLIGGSPVSPGSIKGRNTYMNVIFANTALRRPVQSATPSDDHDVAMIKVELPESLSKVTMKDDYDNVKPGQTVTVMGYPGVAPEQYVVRKSNDPFKPNSQFTTVPTPTVTTGNIGRIIPASSDKNLTYSAFGDSYQLTINATGAGNSGGPMFDDEGNVIGIYYAGKSDARGTQISFAIPIKYGLELMGRKKVANQ